MREIIDYVKEEITKEIIKVDFQNKKNKKEEYVKMTKVEYLKRLYKLLRLLENQINGKATLLTEILLVSHTF